MFLLQQQVATLELAKPRLTNFQLQCMSSIQESFPMKERKKGCGEKEPQNPGIIYMNHYG